METAESGSARTRHIYGIDFSGAKDAGKKIWIARGSIEGDSLCIEDCRRASDLPGSSMYRNDSLSALREIIAGAKHSVFGLDFPFGLPGELVTEHSWEEFIERFSTRYLIPKEFRQACHSAFNGSELKRTTDRETHVPFSPYNLRLYPQAYFGIRDVLAPFVREGRACVLPMQSPLSHLSWVVEICPACTLKRERLYTSYKGTSREHRTAREHILAAIVATGLLRIPDQDLRSRIVMDPGGDALDSVIAAFATSRSLTRMTDGYTGKQLPYLLEGFIFV